MKLTPFAVGSSLLLSLAFSGCSLLPRNQTLLSAGIPHRLSQSCNATVWARQADGTFVEQDVLLEKGWWVASPQIIDTGTEPNPPASNIHLGLQP